MNQILMLTGGNTQYPALLVIDVNILIKICSPKDPYVSFRYHQKVYFPCRMSIQRIASFSEILPR